MSKITGQGICAGGGGLGSDEVTASSAQVLAGYTALTTDSNDEAKEGTIPSKSKSDVTIASNTATAPSGYYGSLFTVTASELVSGNKELSSSGSALSGINVTNYSTVSISAMPVSTLDNTIISGLAYEESAGDYAWKSTVNIPTGYHTALTIEKTFSNVFPAPATEGTADKMRLGYQLYNHEGKLITGTMSELAAQTITPTTVDLTISSGRYLTGDLTIKGDANLLAKNIKKNVEIFGVVGTAEAGGGVDPSDATATAADIIRGKTAYIADSSKATGTAPLLIASNIEPTSAQGENGDYWFIILE